MDYHYGVHGPWIERSKYTALPFLINLTGFQSILKVNYTGFQSILKVN